MPSTKRSIVAAIVAALLATIGCGAVVLYVRSADARALAGQQAVLALVATKRIPAGTSGAAIRDGGYAEAVPMPRTAVPADALGRIEADVEELVVLADVQPRQLLLRGAFDDASRVSGGLGVPDGKLAVSVEMRASAQVAGYVQPGSRIAIFNTYTPLDGEGRVPRGDGLVQSYDANHVTRLLLPRVEVIAIGTHGAPGSATSADGADAKEESKRSSSTDRVLVTVAVTQEEAERLVHAVQTGLLYLALLDDASDVRPGPGVDNKTLFP